MPYEWVSPSGLWLCLAAFLPAGLVVIPPPDAAETVRTDAVQTDSLPASEHFRLERLAEGVYAAIRNDRGFAVSNAGIVDLGDRTVIFDTFLTPAATRDLRDAAETITGRPVAFVVNSHFHNGHTPGDLVLYVPEAKLVFIGDGLFTARHPWLGDGAPEAWGEVLRTQLQHHGFVRPF